MGLLAIDTVPVSRGSKPRANVYGLQQQGANMSHFFGLFAEKRRELNNEQQFVTNSRNRILKVFGSDTAEDGQGPGVKDPRTEFP